MITKKQGLKDTNKIIEKKDTYGEKKLNESNKENLKKKDVAFLAKYAEFAATCTKKECSFHDYALKQVKQTLEYFTNRKKGKNDLVTDLMNNLEMTTASICEILKVSPKEAFLILHNVITEKKLANNPTTKQLTLAMLKKTDIDNAKNILIDYYTYIIHHEKNNKS